MTPEHLLLRRERVEAARLLHRLARHRAHASHASVADVDAANAVAWRLRSRLRTLAAAVFRRELGVVLDASVEVIQADGMPVRMRLAAVDLVGGTPLSPGWRWSLDGVKLAAAGGSIALSLPFPTRGLRIQEKSGGWKPVSPRLRCRPRLRAAAPPRPKRRSAAGLGAARRSRGQKARAGNR